MRFQAFYLKYKLEMKKASSYRKFSELKLYEKILMIAMMVLPITSIVMAFFNMKLYWLFIVSFIVIIFIVSRIENLESEARSVLENRYNPCSEKRLEIMSKLLQDYSINVNDEAKIKMLIEEAELRKGNGVISEDLQSPITLVLIPGIKKIFDIILEKMENQEAIILVAYVGVIAMLILVLWIAIKPIVHKLLNREYDKYGELIQDLRQWLIFGCSSTEKRDVE